MRHSSWTLFLVPLTLPLVLLCVPGSTQPGETPASAGYEVLGEVPEQALTDMDLPTISLKSGDDSRGETSEALFKD
jgi:hypothetical protein